MTPVTGNSSLDLILMRVQSAKDDAAQMSKSYRDALEAMTQMAQHLTKIAMAIGQILKVLGTFSG